MYEDFSAMSEAMHRIAKNIMKGGLPQLLSPMVFAVTGTGRVSNGILELLKQLPHVEVAPDELEWYFKNAKEDPTSNKKIVIS